MTLSANASAEQQYNSLRSGRALVELADWSSVTLTGKGCQSFLHNFCTNDVKRLAPGESCEAFFTNVRGKIIGHGLVTCGDKEIVIVGAPGQASRLVEHLNRYLIREDVQMRDTTTDRHYVLVTGGGLSFHFAWDLVGNNTAGILWLPAGQLSSLDSLLEDREITLVGGPAFSTARIEAGAPLFGVDFDEANFPQEVGRDRQAISFTKGCYLGQETVARIDALGHVNQRLVGVRFFGNKVPTAGNELSLNEKNVGRITSATFSPRLQAPLALAMVRREANSIGARLKSPVGECEVVGLPAGEAS
jgi:folate-binding protein YgfZ